jgi:hypothetical protein
VKVLKASECVGSSVPTIFLVLPNFHSDFHNSIKAQTFFLLNLDEHQTMASDV